VQPRVIEVGLSRGVVNKRIGQIKRAFKWTVAEELVSANTYHGLQPAVGVVDALNMTVPGYCAQLSAKKGGETVKVPQYSL
jgi:hypothetical protein